MTAAAVTTASILHLEDDPKDHKLLRAALLADGLAHSIERVDSAEDFRARLDDRCYDLILSDYNLRGFDGAAALNIAHELCADVPFIVVSGAMGDIAVADLLKNGATDFVLKEHLDRLGPAIRRALRESEERKARHAAEHAMLAAKEAAESANRAKDRFLAMLSHELRTPLSPVVMTLASVAADPALPKHLAEDLALVRRNIDLEVALIDDLLDLSRVISGKLRLRSAAVGMHTLLQHVLASAAPELAEKKLTAGTDFVASSDTVQGDAARLQQVVWNLLRNAIKFTPEGGRITVRTAGPAAGPLRVEIADTGRGIAAEDLTRLFEPFQQIRPESSREIGGLGLGLAITRSVVELHGGRVSADSPGVERGSTFAFELPTAATATAAAAEPSPQQPCPEPPPGNPAALRVLLVEDHDDTRRMLMRLLSAGGFATTAAASRAEAVRAAATCAFDVVVSDIGLPDATGYELMDELRRSHNLKGIALTGYGMEDDVARAHDAGFAEHLTKPVNFDQLKQVIRSVAAEKG